MHQQLLIPCPGLVVDNLDGFPQVGYKPESRQ